MKQLEFFKRPREVVKPPAGLTEPVLWVQRVVIWKSPGEVLRTVVLRPGLNLIWSPDPGGQTTEALGLDVAIGHGAGKSLFCRLLRYCLGEPTYAPDAQQRTIQRALPDGLVGAEVRVARRTWAVLRPLGHPSRSRASTEIPLDQLFEADLQESSFDAYQADLVGRAIGSHVPRLMPAPGPSDGPNHPWLMAMAWLSRDQECRLRHVLDWRAATSESESPARARDLSRTDQLDALRALLRAILPEEQVLRQQIEDLDRKRKQAELDATHATREIARMRDSLVRDLGIAPSSLAGGELGDEALHRAARARLARVAGQPPASAGVDLEELEALRDHLKTQKIQAEERLRLIESEIQDLPAEIRRLEGEMNVGKAQLSDAEEPVCLTCEVPISRVLATKCKLSDHLPDMANLSAKYEAIAQQKERLSRRLAAFCSEQSALRDSIADAGSRLAEIEGQVRASRKAEREHGEDWFTARNAVGRVQDLRQRIDERREYERAADELKSHITALRAQAEGHRRAGQDNLQRVDDFYKLVVQSVLGTSAAGAIRLTGNSLELHISMDGDRYSAALDSLKVVAFDLAALLVAIEGRSAAPAFLIHDSPREADLGESLYERLFFTVVDAEGKGDQPTLFQYILTTTTPPPERLRREPWLALTLRGTPASERLLKRDL